MSLYIYIYIYINLPRIRGKANEKVTSTMTRILSVQLNIAYSIVL